jgi:hypothetical protein
MYYPAKKGQLSAFSFQFHKQEKKRSKKTSKFTCIISRFADTPWNSPIITFIDFKNSANKHAKSQRSILTKYTFPYETPMETANLFKYSRFSDSSIHA